MQTPQRPDANTSIRGLRTVVYKVTDLAAATRFYSSVLGIAPYFEEPFYAGIKVGTVEDPFGNCFGVIENPHFSLADVK